MVRVASDSTSVQDQPTPLLPEKFVMHPPYPNTLNVEKVLSFELNTPGKVSLKVCDLQGKVVASLVNGWWDTGLR